jgi:hypothetical protein
MDFSQFIGKPVKLTLKNGQTLVGDIKEWVDRDFMNKYVPFVRFEKSHAFNEFFANKFGRPLVLTEEYAKFIDFIDTNQIEHIELVENVIAKIDILTENGKKFFAKDLIIELRYTGMPGLVGIRYRPPNNDKYFDLGAREIKGRTVQIPLTLVFLSYARENFEQVLSISRELNNNGIITWFDEDMLLPGDDWHNRIEQAIRDADYCLVFLSSQTMDNTGYKNRELKLAIEQQSLLPEGKRFIIPVLLDECTPPLSLDKLNWVKISDKDWFKKLLKAVAPFYIRKNL